MSELRSYYPEIEPYETGMLDVGDGHSIYWERVGTKGAKSVVFLHGGPGGGCNPNQRRVFDPALYDVLLWLIDAACLSGGEHNLASRG